MRTSRPVVAVVSASSGPRLKLPREDNLTMLVIALLFVLLYVFRETGGIPVVVGLHGVVDDIVIALTTLLAFSAGGASVRTTVVHGGIGLVAIGLAVAGSVTEVEPLLRSANLVSGYLVLATCIALFAYVLKKTQVTGDTIFGAIAVYLAIGVLFGGIFTMMALETPAAFEPPEFVKFGGETALYYYSFVTLTTLGFGDITPISDLAQILTTLEAILGLVVIAVLIGRVVGLLVNQESDSAQGKGPFPVAPAVESQQEEIQ